MINPAEVARHWWEHYRERPFLRLFRIFVERIFRGGGDADSEGVDLGVGLILTLLALPGGFVSVLMFVKYSTFLSWMRGMPQADPLAVALPDEYFFITLAMAVAGTVSVWRWDAVFPDRRDYMNFVPLPVSTRLIFYSNLAAIVALAALLAFDVNAASSLLFPLGVAATQSSFLFFVKFALVHVLVVALASVFAFFAVLSVLGCLLAILPAQAFRKISPYVRAAMIMYFVTLLSTSFAVPDVLQDVSRSRTWIRLIPSCWFLGLCQSLRGHASPDLEALAQYAVPSVALAIALALLVYAVGYRRHFLRIPELAETPATHRIPRLAWARELFDRKILRTPFQQGCFHFVCRTLFRSEAHRLALAGIFGLGVVVASQFLASPLQVSSAPTARLSGDTLAVPFVLAFIVIVGLRAIFEIPADLRSTWIFRLTLDPEKHESRSSAQTIILTFVMPWIVLIVLPAYSYFDGVRIGLIHTTLVSLWSVLLVKSVLIRFRKVPFTCPMPVFQQHSIVTLLGGALEFFVFSVLTPAVESWAVVNSIRMMVFLPLAALFWYIPRLIENSASDVERNLIFEEPPTRAVQLLQLGE
jgi:hypothetical protein